MVVPHADTLIETVVPAVISFVVAYLTYRFSLKHDLARFQREVVMGPHFDQMRALIAEIDAVMGHIESGPYWEFSIAAPKVRRLAQHFRRVGSANHNDPGQVIASALNEIAETMRAFDARLLALGDEWKRLKEAKQEPGAKRDWLDEQSPEIAAFIDACREAFAVTEVNVSPMQALATTESKTGAPNLDGLRSALEKMRSLRLPPGS